MNFTIRNSSDNRFVYVNDVPYNEDFVRGANLLHGFFSRNNRSWRFKIEHRDAVSKLLEAAFKENTHRVSGKR